MSSKLSDNGTMVEWLKTAGLSPVRNAIVGSIPTGVTFCENNNTSKHVKCND